MLNANLQTRPFLAQLMENQLIYRIKELYIRNEYKKNVIKNVICDTKNSDC